MRLSFLAFLAVQIQFVIIAPRADAADYAGQREPIRGGFSPSIFLFVTTVPDDGQGKAGGWQEAVATLKFTDMRHLLPDRWTCTIKVQMPIRSEKYGVITPDVAASMSASAATSASVAVMHRQPRWIAVSYCIQFKDEVELTLNTVYKQLGARVWRL